MAIKEKLIECRGRKDEAESVLERLRDVINANRGIFSIAPMEKSPDKPTVGTGK
jgi:hypothetical protein